MNARTKPVTRDRDIRAALLPLLRQKYIYSSQDLVIEEFGCNSARVDVAVVNGVMHGFEIKSDSDSTYRLQDQLQSYLGVFDFITLVAGRRLFHAVRSMAPRRCGLILAERVGGEVRLIEKRKAQRNPKQRAIDLARMMWRDEALHVLRSRGYKCVNTRNSANEIWAAAADQLKIPVLANELRMAIKLRGGSGFARRSEPDGGSCTIGSTALLDHYSENLAQLLSVLSRDRLG
jgi:hypothetical protein